MNKLIATLTVIGKIKCVTGLHIGGTKGGYEIGGVENIVIRDIYNDFPYIPGSSLKGKMRSLLEWAEGYIDSEGNPYKGKEINKDSNGKPILKKGDLDEPILLLFGAASEDERPSGPGRLIIRDAFPDDETKEKMEKLEKTQGLPKVEIKTEVTINRISSESSGLRKIERVPIGSKFNFEMVYFLYDVDGVTLKDYDLIEYFFEGLRLLEISSLGGSGSRGYGQICFELDELLLRKAEDYKSGADAEKWPNKLNINDKTEVDALKEHLKNLYNKNDQREGLGN